MSAPCTPGVPEFYCHGLSHWALSDIAAADLNDSPSGSASLRLIGARHRLTSLPATGSGYQPVIMRMRTRSLRAK
jgi:hypothetical protein